MIAMTTTRRFYQRRMIPHAGGWAGRSLDDFGLAFGGGADVLLSQQLALCPDLTVLLVTTRSHAHAVPVFGAQLAYHFESHPVTPSAR